MNCLNGHNMAEYINGSIKHTNIPYLASFTLVPYCINISYHIYIYDIYKHIYFQQLLFRIVSFRFQLFCLMFARAGFGSYMWSSGITQARKILPDFNSVPKVKYFRSFRIFSLCCFFRTNHNSYLRISGDVDACPPTDGLLERDSQG